MPAFKKLFTKEDHEKGLCDERGRRYEATSTEAQRMVESGEAVVPEEAIIDEPTETVAEEADDVVTGAAELLVNKIS